MGKKVAGGYYVNSLAMISQGKIGNRDYLNETRDERYTGFALGFGLGGKFVSRQGNFLDLGYSIGRNLFSNQSPTVLGQFTLNLGYRF